MNKLYTGEIEELVKSTSWGVKGIVVDIIEYWHPTPYLTLVLRPSNFNSYSTHDRIKVAERVNELCDKINKKGCPCYVEFWE